MPTCSVTYVHMIVLLRGEVAAEEVPDAQPAFVGRLHAIHGAIDGEEPVTGVLIRVELVLLAEPRQLGVDLRDVVRRRMRRSSPRRRRPAARTRSETTGGHPSNIRCSRPSRWRRRARADAGSR